jgi:hypothetical protein
MIVASDDQMTEAKSIIGKCDSTLYQIIDILINENAKL